MKAKKLVALGMATVMTCALASCGGNKTETKEASSSKGGEENKTITFWNIGTENPDASILQSAVENYNSKSDNGYKVELTAIQNDKYKEKLVIAMSSGECPDMYTSWTGGPLQEYISSGYAQPITSLYKEAGLDKK